MVDDGCPAASGADAVFFSTAAGCLLQMLQTLYRSGFWPRTQMLMLCCAHVVSVMLYLVVVYPCSLVPMVSSPPQRVIIASPRCVL